MVGAGSSGSSAMSRVRSSAWASGFRWMFLGLAVSIWVRVMGCFRDG